MPVIGKGTPVKVTLRTIHLNLKGDRASIRLTLCLCHAVIDLADLRYFDLLGWKVASLNICVVMLKNVEDSFVRAWITSKQKIIYQ